MFVYVAHMYTYQQGCVYSLQHCMEPEGYCFKAALHTPKRYVIWKDFDSGVFWSLTTWNFVNWQLGIDEGIHLSHICLVEAKLSEEILSHGAPFVFCGDL